MLGFGSEWPQRGGCGRGEAKLRGSRSSGPSLSSLALLATAFLVWAVACGAAENEPCKERNDCRSDLLCCPIDRTPTLRGTCQQECRPRVLPMDAAVPQLDATVDDGGSDAGDASSDGGAGDASMDATMG